MLLTSAKRIVYDDPLPMRTIPLYNRQGQRLLTLKEAENKGYGSVFTLKKRLNRGQLRGYKIGPLWLILEASLARPPKSHRKPRFK
jgi:hypothetical protein